MSAPNVVKIEIWPQDHPLVPWAYSYAVGAGYGGGNSAVSLDTALDEATERVRATLRLDASLAQVTP